MNHNPKIVAFARLVFFSPATCLVVYLRIFEIVGRTYCFGSHHSNSRTGTNA